MYQTVLVAVDLTDQSRQLVKKAAKVALENNATLVICHVSQVAYIDGGYETYLYTGYDNEVHDIDVKKLNKLKELAYSLGAKNVVSEIVTSTSVAATILYEICENYSVDLIMVGSHTNKKVQHFILGNVATSIVRHAKCDVFVNKNFTN